VEDGRVAIRKGGRMTMKSDWKTDERLKLSPEDLRRSRGVKAMDKALDDYEPVTDAERIPAADLRAGPVINALENLANSRIRESDLELLAKTADDDLKAAVDIMSNGLPNDFDLTMSALRNVARRALGESPIAGIPIRDSHSCNERHWRPAKSRAASGFRPWSNRGEGGLTS
jgi:hypothetical protein